MFFLYVNVYSIQYTMHWEKTQILKNLPSDKICRTKNTLFFLSWAPTYHSSTFNLTFLYELKHEVRLSKIGTRIFYIRFRFVFIEVYIFIQQNTQTL